MKEINFKNVLKLFSIVVISLLILAIGGILNGIVITSNEWEMPVAKEKLVINKDFSEKSKKLLEGKPVDGYHVENDNTKFKELDDRILFSKGGSIYSYGDLFMNTGIFVMFVGFIVAIYRRNKYPLIYIE